MMGECPRTMATMMSVSSFVFSLCSVTTKSFDSIDALLCDIQRVHLCQHNYCCAGLRGGGDNPFSSSWSLVAPVIDGDLPFRSMSKLFPDWDPRISCPSFPERGQESETEDAWIVWSPSEGDRDTRGVFQSADSSGSSGISLKTILSAPFTARSLFAPADARFPLNLLPHVACCASVEELNLLDVKDVWNSRKIGRNSGIHCTMMVPVISDEYLDFRH